MQNQILAAVIGIAISSQLCQAQPIPVNQADLVNRDLLESASLDRQAITIEKRGARSSTSVGQSDSVIVRNFLFLVAMVMLATVGVFITAGSLRFQQMQPQRTLPKINYDPESLSTLNPKRS